MTDTCTLDELHAMLGDGEEIALLDVREVAPFGRRHLLYAVSIPLGRLELEVAARVPRRSARTVLCDEDDGRAERAASRLAALGYTDVRRLDGGVAAWAAAGHETYEGLNVPSKAFGELVEYREGTPCITAADLAAKVAAGEDLVILDSRPFDEYRVMSIPGGTCVPGAELAYRFTDVVPGPDTLVVVNCAGRTRSIIGAQSLRNAGYSNPIVALENGTMGWHLAGLTLERGGERRPPPLSREGLAAARAAAARVRERFGVPAIDRKTLAAWRSEADRRTLHVLDVRGPEEYEAGHLADAMPAPGGQLVQATDRYVGTLGARLVLVDDTGVRATMTASWLRQMGWNDAVVLESGLDGEALVPGPYAPPVLGLDGPAPAWITPAGLMEALAAGEAAVLDVGPSPAFRAGHVPGARHGSRIRLPDALAALPAGAPVVLTSPDGTLARLAAAEAETAAGAPVRALAGGTAAWSAAGFPLATGDEGMTGPADDVWLRPYDRSGGVEASMQAYLDWEVNLTEQIRRDGTVRF